MNRNPQLFCRAILLALAIPICWIGDAAAQVPDGYKVVHGFAVSGYSEGIRIGYVWCPDAASAQVEKAKMERVETTRGKYYDRVTITPEDSLVRAEREPKSQWEAWYDAARRSTEKIQELREKIEQFRALTQAELKAKERQVADTLKEYQDNIKAAYERASKASAAMKSMTGEISQKQFDDVNKLINNLNGYNKSMDSYQRLIPGTRIASAPSMAPLRPTDLKARITPDTMAKVDPPKKAQPAPPPAPVPAVKPFVLAGSTLAGSENLGGYGKLSFRFNANGTATMYDTDGATNGSWSQNGNSVTLTFYNGNVRYTGTLNGRTLSGTATNGKSTWSWSMSN